MIGSVTVSGTYVNHFKASPWKSKTKQLEWSLGWFIIKDSLLLPMGKPFGRLGLPGIPYQNRCVKDTLLAVQLFLRPPPGSVMGALIKNLQDHQCNAQQYHDINHPVMNVVLGWFDCFFSRGLDATSQKLRGEVLVLVHAFEQNANVHYMSTCWTLQAANTVFFWRNRSKDQLRIYDHAHIWTVKV